MTPTPEEMRETLVSYAELCDYPTVIREEFQMAQGARLKSLRAAMTLAWMPMAAGGGKKGT